MAEKKTPAVQQSWFSKEGEVYGPFSDAEVERLKEEGEYEKFSWVWSRATQRWVGINPPPRPPIEDFSESAPEMEEQTPVEVEPEQEASAQEFVPDFTPERVESSKGSKLERNLQALCHDQRTIISGTVSRLLEDGFVMTSKDYSTSSPPFHRGWTIWLNLLDEAKGCTENIRAKIVRIGRQDDATWFYEFQWEEMPKILQL